jgi:hypothetical protein
LKKVLQLFCEERVAVLGLFVAGIYGEKIVIYGTECCRYSWMNLLLLFHEGIVIVSETRCFSYFQS